MKSEWSDQFNRQVILVDFRLDAEVKATELIDYALEHDAVLDGPKRAVIRFAGKPAEAVQFNRLPERLAAEKQEWESSRLNH